MAKPEPQRLLTLPPRMAREFETLEGRRRPDWFAASDPPGSRLGSGGGTGFLLAEAWRATGGNRCFAEWLSGSRKLIVHGGGQSRRLPAYAPMGKLLMPLPVFRWARGQRLNQTLLDLQLPEFERVLAQAGSETVAMVSSGDVLLRFSRDLPVFPSVDVLGLGMWVKPEKAKDFGVFFSPRRHPGQLGFFLQKPSPTQIRDLASDYLALVDTGMWLLSERAVRVLLGRCGWDWEKQTFQDGCPKPYELYGQFGLALGHEPRTADPDVNALSSAVVALPEAEFHHFGTSAQMIESASDLQNLELDETKLGLMGAKRHPDVHLQNSRFDYPLVLEENHSLWVENSVIPSGWRLRREHVLTGVPDNHWNLNLTAGICLDFVPVGEAEICFRPYGFRDSFRGALGEATTEWMAHPVMEWLARRQMDPNAAGLDPAQDIQEARLFPVWSPTEIEPEFIRWMIAEPSNTDAAWAEKWRRGKRLSAADLAEEVNLERLYSQRQGNRDACLLPLLNNHQWSVFFKLDLESTAAAFARTGSDLPPESKAGHEDLEPMQRVHDRMFRGAVMRHRGQDGWEKLEHEAFASLREMIVAEAQLSAALPQRQVLEDQIVWGRSPVRLDLAGGWSDTPPYCIEEGGKVLNLAVDLNGQPPIQVFGKLSSRHELVLRSIDLGVEHRIRTYEELDTFAEPGSEFALAKAAFALAGFLPRFHARGGHRSLEEQLRAFGGGIEISMLAAVPKGSGLGTSSILAATLLATLADLCGLNWDRNVLFTRTLALEQMLTTGGGWQDQAGAVFGGIKLIETAPGLAQKPMVRWLPPQLFESHEANRRILLYYTGITRLAKSILQEIVRGIFLNSPVHLRVIDKICANADRAVAAIQACDFNGLIEAVGESWRLNQELDGGTNPPEVQEIFRRVEGHLASAKLLGAGGGGYLVMLVRDEEDGQRVRQILTRHPPNGRARFVDFSLSGAGLQLTRS